MQNFKKLNVIKAFTSISLIVFIIVSQIHPTFALEEGVDEIVEDELTPELFGDEAAAKAAMDQLYNEMAANIPTGEEVITYTNNYQSMEPEDMTYYLGSATTLVNNGLQVNTSGRTVASWTKGGFLSSGIMDIDFQVDKVDENTDMGLSLMSSGADAGIGIRHTGNGRWVIQASNSQGNWKAVTAVGAEISHGNTHNMKVGYLGDRLIIYVNNVLLYDGTDFIPYIGYSGQNGQFGLYDRSGGNQFKVEKIEIKGIGTKEKVKLNYFEDYETTTNADLDWTKGNVQIVDDGTGNNVLEFSGTGDTRSTDLNSPQIEDGTLALRFKVVDEGRGYTFGFRHSNDTSKFSEIGVHDGNAVWTPESNKTYGGGIAMSVPQLGVWNDLMFNFVGSEVTMYLNKEYIGTFTWGDFNLSKGHFGLRTRGGKLQIDDVRYTEEILVPEKIKEYINDFEDGISGTWSEPTALVKEGRNGVLQVPTSTNYVKLEESNDLQLSKGSVYTEFKPVDDEVSFMLGDYQIRYETGKWQLFDGTTTVDFVGDALTEAPVAKKWNKIAITFDETKIGLSINGKTASLPISGYTPGYFGLKSAGTVYLDNLSYTEQSKEFDTTINNQKVIYKEYYDTETSIDYTGLDGIAQSGGRLNGSIAPGVVAINNDIEQTGHGVYQFKLSTDQTTYGFEIGNTKFSVDAAGQWTYVDDGGISGVIGNATPYVVGTEQIVRIEIVKGNVTLSVNNQLIGTVEVANYVGALVGIYNPSTTNAMQVSIDAIAVEEVLVYKANYSDNNWIKIDGNSSFTYNPDNVVIKMPGVNKALDDSSYNVKDQIVNVDFSVDVDDSMSGGRYGFIIRGKSSTEHVAITLDINGSWMATYNNVNYPFAIKYSPEPNKVYHAEIEAIGTKIFFKITDDQGVTTDFGSVDVPGSEKSGKFGIKGWYGTKNMTLKNLEVTEKPNLENWYLNSNSTTITRDGLSIEVDEEYPRIIEYELNGKIMKGQTETLRTVFINGIAYEPTTTSTLSSDGFYRNYVMTFPTIDVVVKLTLGLEDGHIVTMNVTEITENATTLVRSFSMDSNTLLYTDSAQTDSSYALASATGQWHGVHDEIADRTSDMISAGKAGATIALVSANGLAASIENNTMSGGQKFIANKEKKALVSKIGISNGAWTYRHALSDEIEGLPWFKVTIGEDQNSDGTVDWQDAAVLYRETIYTKNFESEDMANNMMYIAYNFASQAQDPFLNSLDTGKVLYNFTDGFGQMVLHKGYQAEGHDDDIPSYSNIGVRQGGIDDFNYLINEGAKYNLNIGVHLNATEYHLDANELYYDALRKGANGSLSGGWDWIDASYYVDQTYEVLNGQLKKRFTDLANLTKDSTDPNDPMIDFYYIDVYTGNDYNAYKLVEYANSLGIKVGTEFAGPIEPGVSFVHWGPDLGYPNKGNNSLVNRIVKSNQDLFIGHSLFKGQKIPGVTTWQDSKPDMQQGVTVFYNEVLPTKYMQHFGVMKAEEDKITFADDVVSERKTGGYVELSKDGKLISKWRDHGTTTDEGQRHTSESLSLIPWMWDTKTNELLDADNGGKLYHWNPTGGTTTWQLTDEFSGVTSFEMYELTQQGKKLVGTVASNGSDITVTAEKNTPYILIKAGSYKLPDAKDWGEGAAVADFAFNAESLDGTQVWDSDGSAIVETVPGNENYLGATGNLSRWNKQVVLDGDANISQDLKIQHLVEGEDYTISVWAKVDDGQKATMSVKIGDKEYTNYVTGKDKKHLSSYKYVNTDFQKLSVKFNVPAGTTTGSIKISSSGDVGKKVTLDDVKTWKHLTVNPELNSDKYVVYEDFENVSHGWGPFEYLGGNRNTHIASDRSNPNDNNPVVPKDSGQWGPVMTWVLDGENSLKINEKGVGRGVKTNENEVKLLPNTNYEMSFLYTLNAKANYKVEVKSRTTNHVVATWDLDHMDNSGNTNKPDTEYITFKESFTTGVADDYQIIIVSTSFEDVSTSQITLMLDNFFIIDKDKQEVIDVSELEALIQECELLDPNDYIQTTWDAFELVLADTKNLVGQITSEDQLREVIASLTAAKSSLVEKADTTDLDATIAEAKTLNKDDYSTATWTIFEKALQEAEAVAQMNKRMLSVAEANKNLRDAMGALVNIKDLKTLLATAESIANDNYTTESWNAFKASIELGKQTIVHAISDGEVLSQIDMLTQAKNGLVKKGSIKALEALVVSVVDLQEADYTPESWTVFKEVLERAEAVIATNDSSQAAIDQVLQELKDAQEGLTALNYSYKDPKTGITISWKYGVLPQDPVFAISKLADSSKEYALMQDLYKGKLSKMHGYSTIITKDDAPVVVNGRFNVSIPIPKGYDISALQVFSIDGEEVVEIKGFNTANAHVSFDVEKVSSYVIGERIEKTDPGKPNPKDPTKPIPITGTQANYTWQIALAGISLVAIVFVLAKKKKDSVQK